jgi:hypothetical protein
MRRWADERARLHTVSRLHGQVLDEGDVGRVFEGDVGQLSDNSGL